MYPQVLREPQNIALLGIIGALGFSLLWAVAVFVDGSWVFGEMTLSVLGDPSRPADAIFNLGCILAGIVLVVFAMAMRPLQKNRILRLTFGLVALASFFLIGVGLFPIHIEFWHNLFAWAYFLTMMGAVVISIPGDWYLGGRGRAMALFTLLMVLISVALLAFTALALAEAVAAIFIMTWALMRSLDLVL